MLQMAKSVFNFQDTGAKFNAVESFARTRQR